MLMAVVAACILSVAACGGEGTPIPELPAAQVDLPDPEPLSGWRRWAIDLVLEGRVWQGARSGFVALVARDGRLIHASLAGYADIEAELPMAIDTRFQMASMTKPITAVAAMILVEEGRLHLDDPVARYLPAFADMQVAILDDEGEVVGKTPQSPEMKIRHLLSFASGIAGSGFEPTPLGQQWRDDGIYAGKGSLAQRIERLPHLLLLEQPGTQWRYGAALDVMARIVEIAADEPLEAFMKRRIFDPLGMHSTYYGKDVPADAPLARLYTQDESGKLVPAPGPTLRPPDWTPGGSGLVSTAPDYMRFALMLWNEGAYNDTRILKAETVQTMKRLEVASGVLEIFEIEGLGFGLGVSVVADQARTVMASRNGDFWWSGAYGTHFWVSPETGVALVVLQQNEMSETGGPPIVPFLVQQLALTD
ncbi:MAG: serine hydrolase [Deltaproteobacteria bacterium]|jgi:CubicO group peptidase (beta-lactamase class C family)|nr:serine hydrolase [Deltaproteobacteria bacterium]